MTDEFIREVDEDIKEEKRIKLWKKLFPYVASISLGIVLFTSGFVFWDGYSNNQRQKLGDDFTAAVVLASEEDLDASLLASLEDVVVFLTSPPLFLAAIRACAAFFLSDLTLSA